MRSESDDDSPVRNSAKDGATTQDHPLPLSVYELGDCTCSIVFGIDVEGAVMEMRHRIHLATRLTASAGSKQ